MSALSRGRRLGVDVGKVRVGVAVSDPDGILATPLVTVARGLGGAGPPPPGGTTWLASRSGRVSPGRPRWRSGRAGWTLRGGRDDRRAGPGVRRARRPHEAPASPGPR